VNRAEQIRGLREIFQREFEEQLLPRLALRELAFDRIVVVAAVLDRVVEDRRVGCSPVTESSSMYRRSTPVFNKLRVMLSSQRLWPRSCSF